MEFSTKFDAKAIENEVRNYLDNLDLRAHLENELAGKELVGYIEGPPTMNGEPHAGHLRGRIIKDLWYRFNTLQKKKVIFRAGWDTQGLPVELQAEKELGLTGSKAENISKVGVEKIVETCKKIIHFYNEKWVAVDKLLGISFNYEKAYWTFRDSYIEREWQYMRKAWESGVLREWFRVVAYCPSCQTSLSNAEVNQGYETVEDPSFYYKVKLADEDAYMIVWTTMPFTIVTDEMVGANPKADYNYVRANGERWVVGADRMQDLMRELRIEDYAVEKTVKGSELDGKHYIHPLLHMIPGLAELASNGSIHFVVAEDFVDTATGSGLVHLSPANGEEDFEVAAKRNVPIFVPIDDRVIFTEKAGSFKDLFVRDADMKVVQAMKEAGASVKLGKIKHQYPTCWRSHHKVVWLARREYFYIIEKLGDKPLQAAQNVEYFFEPPKNRFVEIIREQHPWCISRERVWGTPLPVWSCAKCGHKDALFSRAEIVKNAIELPDGPNFELHRPWIDRIKIKCEKCGAAMQREPFVLDTWHNSGAAPYASLTDEEYHDLIPATFLTEGIDQTRGWAYTLLMENVIMNQAGVAPFQSFLFQGHVLDEKGNKMSKSLGNVIEARTLLSDNPVDLVRLYFMWKSSPIESLNFSLDEMRTRSYQILSTLHNLHVYFKQNSEFDKFDQGKHVLQWVADNNLLGQTEVWLLSKLQGLIAEVTDSFARCRFHEGAKAIDEFIINHLSQTYIPLTRNVIWDDSAENLDRRLAVYSVLGHVLMQIDIMLHPLSPFITEYLYLTCFFGKKKSVLLESWPRRDEKLVNAKIESAFDRIKEIVSLANAARNLAGLKRRWPIREVIICGQGLQSLDIEGVSDALKSQLNAGQYRLVEISTGSQLEKVAGLLDSKMPISVSVELVRKNVAPRVKADIGKVVQAFENIDKLRLLGSLRSGNYSLTYDDGKTVELSPSDVEVAYKAAEGYSSSERGDLVVFISTTRDKDLMVKGLIRDLARQLQQLRKERQYNPTDILDAAYVAGLEAEEIAALSAMKDELTYLVRVKNVSLSKEPLDNKVNYKTVEIDGREFRISVE
ncbi:isoleucine--tRNA ligase [Candidatus Nitrososphaera gargensis Ga9.2]|uniref:Isoleucine--tRNA ligase n=1 Tax=Nitrososphaera gargensis (strain Ga9.2) TaxID=1237085 RepID=K0IM26_NITGG|nr:isoleucine--tRNA ligase [Candidatus Nitrososphaera gargensis]AFU57519.1 isoleucine--tRNA ligase [Candidatus Nitrososphaera gargensis Ga9.2]